MSDEKKYLFFCWGIIILIVASWFSILYIDLIEISYSLTILIAISLIGLIIVVNFLKRLKIRRKITLIKHQFKELNDEEFDSFSNAVKDIRLNIENTFVSLGSSINNEFNLLETKVEKKYLKNWEKSFENNIIGYENRVEYYRNLKKQYWQLKIYQLTSEKHNLYIKLEQIMNRERNVHIKKTVLEQGSQFARLEVPEIAEVCGINKPKLIISILNEMINDGEIHARYFESTQSVSFNQQANLEELNRLDDLFGEWREKEILKLDKI